MTERLISDSIEQLSAVEIALETLEEAGFGIGDFDVEIETEGAIFQLEVDLTAPEDVLSEDGVEETQSPPIYGIDPRTHRTENITTQDINGGYSMHNPTYLD